MTQEEITQALLKEMATLNLKEWQARHIVTFVLDSWREQTGCSSNITLFASEK